MASSPSGSLLLFFSASFAFFFFLKLIFSFSLLDLTLCSWWAACGVKALDLGSLSVTVDRCLTLLPPSLFARCCLTLLTTKNTTRASSSGRPIAMAITAHSHAGVGSLRGRIENVFYYYEVELFSFGLHDMEKNISRHLLQQYLNIHLC